MAAQDSYVVRDGELEAKVTIVRKPGEHINSYMLDVPKVGAGTGVFLDDVKAELLRKVPISSQEALNIKMADELREKFMEYGTRLLRQKLQQLPDEKIQMIARRMTQEMLGLGDIEFILRDDNIEEICVNGSAAPLWIYHRKYGWLKTNLSISSENQVWNYASSIARGVGRQINIQTPLLDAYLSTGDRVNATLAPVSYSGNTITIRKFARKPWTITDYIRLKTISTEVAALLWLAIQYEMNIIVSGGTGSGKTSLLNVLSMFIPQNQRVVSIEQTREITLPQYLQWVPMVVREPTSEGRGAVSMLDLMVNSLRMRPDRIIVGEIRRAEEAEVLFEGMHTGHSVYATLHAETVSETLRRLVSPPLSIPPVMLESLHLVVAMYRDRRSNIRRIYEVGELAPSEKEDMRANLLYRWKPYKDEIAQYERSVRLMDEIKMHANMDDEELKDNLKGKQAVLEWLAKKNINSISEVGGIISEYYDEPDAVIKKVRKQ